MEVNVQFVDPGWFNSLANKFAKSLHGIFCVKNISMYIFIFFFGGRAELGEGEREEVSWKVYAIVQ